MSISPWLLRRGDDVNLSRRVSVEWTADGSSPSQIEFNVNELVMSINCRASVRPPEN